MKLNKILSILFAGALAMTQALAQTNNARNNNLAVSDEELMKYATATDSVNEMLANVRLDLTDMIKESNVMSGARYNELSKIVDDPSKLATVQATPEEIAFVKQVNTKRDEEMARVNTTYQALAKEYVTGTTFNKVKKALANDPKVKKRYDSLMVELAKDDPTGDQ
jgi:hypothetical protein